MHGTMAVLRPGDHHMGTVIIEILAVIMNPSWPLLIIWLRESFSLPFNLSPSKAWHLITGCECKPALLVPRHHLHDTKNTHYALVVSIMTRTPYRPNAIQTALFSFQHANNKYVPMQNPKGQGAPKKGRSEKQMNEGSLPNNKAFKVPISVLQPMATAPARGQIPGASALGPRTGLCWSNSCHRSWVATQFQHGDPHQDHPTTF